jgi:hypothetical protein
VIPCAIAVAALAAAAAGCAGEESEGGRYARAVAERVPVVEKAVGLTFKQPPRFAVKTREQVREFVTQQFEDSTYLRDLEGQSRAYKLFGLLPDSLDVKPFLLDLLTEQIAGYYDPKTDTLYIVESGQDDPVTNVTITHELVHALQDQYLDLDSLQEVRGDNDRQVAAASVIEGHATFEQMELMNAGNFGALAGGWDGVREAIREGMESMPVLATAPLFIQETLIFPYLSGAEFVYRFDQRHEGEPPLRRLPVSTEQVLHIEAYESNDVPTPLRLPAPRGARGVYENDLGEFETRLLLYETLRDLGGASRAATGWDGDRYMVVETPTGEGIVWATVWDSAVDAGEFLGLMERWVPRHLDAGAPAGGSGERRVYSGRGRRAALSTGEVGGRPVVLYVEVPDAASPDLVTIPQLRLGAAP